jgi:antitoxin FitA
MTQPLLENLNPVLVSQLEMLATIHRRSLQEEIEFIPQQSVQQQLRSRSTGGDRAATQAALARTQTRYAGQQFSDSTDLIRQDRG